MRVAVAAAIIALAGLSSLGAPAADGDEGQVSEYLARVQGIALHLEVDGKPPCDFVRDRMLTSAKFVLNSANIPFDSNPDSKEGEDRSNWGPSCY